MLSIKKEKRKKRRIRSFCFHAALRPRRRDGLLGTGREKKRRTPSFIV